MNEQTDRGPLLQRQHAVQQGNLSSAAQRMAQPTANEGFQLQSSLPYGNNPYSRAGFAGEHNGIAMPMVPDESGEKLPLFYWWGLAAWNKTRGTARVDLMRPRWLSEPCYRTSHAACPADCMHAAGTVYRYPGADNLCC